MSRVHYNEDATEGSQALWEHNAHQALRGKKGQAALKEIEAALLALPHKRLIEQYLYMPSGIEADDPEAVGDVCVLGALALHRGLPLQKIEQYAEDDTDEIAYWLKLTRTFAWELMEKNDEWFSHATPEQRYQGVLDWVRKNIHGS